MAEDAKDEVLQRALDLGYDPNRYPQDDPRWKTPEEFVEFGERVAPIMAENNKRYEKMYRDSQAELAKIREEVQKFAKIHEETEQRTREAIMAELKERKKQALAEGDVDAVVDLDEQIAEARQAKPKVEATEQAAQESPQVEQAAFESWAKENDSWLKDEELQMAAQIIGTQLRNKGVPFKGEDFKSYLDQVTEVVKQRYPHKFESDEVIPNAVESSGERSGMTSGRKHTYANLPKEAKEACDLLVSTIPGMTREKYVAAYQWDKK